MAGPHIKRLSLYFLLKTKLGFRISVPVPPSLLRGDERLEAGDGLLLDLLLHLRHHLLQWSEKEEGFSQ